MRIYKSEKETRALAEEMAAELLGASTPHPTAVVLGLVGDLGAGKTTFAQGFARALGVKEKITSPTFLIVKSYKLKVKSFKKFYHIDAYRLKDEKELLDLGFAELLKDPKNIILIEWADKLMGILPKDAVYLNFSHSEKEGERVIEKRF